MTHDEILNTTEDEAMATFTTEGDLNYFLYVRAQLAANMTLDEEDKRS